MPLLVPGRWVPSRPRAPLPPAAGTRPSPGAAVGRGKGQVLAGVLWPRELSLSLQD